MKNSRKLILIVLLALLLIAAITVAACTPDDPHKGNDPNSGQGGGGNQGGGDKPTHQHTFAQEWSISDAEHWHAATCGHDVTADNAAHTLVNNVCSVCGYQNDVNWDDFTFEQSDDGYILTKYNGTAAHVNIPDTYNDLPVVGTGVDAFWECRESLVSVTIPASVTIIGEYAFGNCYNLATVNFGANSKIESIGDEIFRGCSSLISITIPDSVTSIDEGAFFGCSSLTSIDIPDSVKTIGEFAFYACFNLAAVNFGNNSNLESIEDGAFGWCGSLTSIFIHEGIANISHAPFWGCYSLIIYCETSEQPLGWVSDWNELNSSNGNPVVWNCKQNNVADDGCIYDTVDGIRYGFKDNQAKVYGNNYSGDVTIPSNVQYRDKDYIVTSISPGAFALCENLTSLTIPSTVSNMNFAVLLCHSLVIYCEASEQPAGWISDWNKDDGFYCPVVWNCNQNNIADDGYVYDIVDGIRYGFKNGQAKVMGNDYKSDVIVIPSTVNYQDSEYLVTSIGDGAFYFCSSLTSIFIPKSVANMGNDVFEGCYNLTIYCEASEQPSGWYPYWNCFRSPWDSQDHYCPIVWGATRQDAEQH